MFGSGSVQCLALCEVVNPDGRYKPHPYYVVPDETHVMTRFFFIYTGSGTASVKAESLKVPPLSSLSL
jgi:hypothetical protein